MTFLIFNFKTRNVIDFRVALRYTHTHTHTHTHIHATVCKIDEKQGGIVQHREIEPLSYDSLGV